MSKIKQTNIVRGLSHIAIAVNSFSDIEKWLQLFPNEKVSEYLSEKQKVRAKVVKLDEFDIEFLEPLDGSSTISNFLKKNPRGGLHHICFYVDDLEESLIHLRQSGIRNISLQNALGVIHQSPIAFLNPKDLSGVLVEFEQIPPK